MGKRITAAYPIAKAGGIPINTSIPASKETYDRLGGRDVAFVVLHYTGNVSDTAEANCKYFAGGDRRPAHTTSWMRTASTSPYRPVTGRGR